MELKKMQIKMLSCCFIAGGLTLAGCSTDDSIDVGDVDTTIGVKLDNFTVPLGKTEDISIEDLLELNDDDCIQFIKEDASGKYITINGKKIILNSGNTGDYIFYKQGDDVEAAEPEVDKVKFEMDGTRGGDFGYSFYLPEIPAIAATTGYDIPAQEQTIKTFAFSGTKDEMVLSLTHASANTTVNFGLNFSSLKNAGVDYVKLIEFELPDYMEMELTSGLTGLGEGSGWNQATHKLTLKHVPTTSARTISMKLTGLTNFKKNMSEVANPAKDNYLLLNKTNLDMQGNVNMKMELSLNDIHLPTTEGTYSVVANVSLGNTIEITEATGYFNPDIDIDDIGDIEIGDDVPDFLKDKDGKGDVDLTLSNPNITLSVESNIDAKGLIDATMTAYYKDKAPKTMTLNNIVVNPHKGATGTTTSVIYICRKNEGAPAGATVIVKDGSDGDLDIAQLLNEIPDKIKFTCSAKADETVKSSIKLGTKYKIKPAYSFSAPLALEAGSKIVYEDKADGFYEDIEDNDIDFRGKADLVITGKVTNNSPLDLELVPTAVDVNGNPLNGIKLESVNKIKSNLTDKTPSELKVLLTKDANVNLKDVKFDGIKFKAKATSANATTLNKDKHSIRIEDLKVSINSEVSIDADSKKNK